MNIDDKISDVGKRSFLWYLHEGVGVGWRILRVNDRKFEDVNQLRDLGTYTIRFRVA